MNGTDPTQGRLEGILSEGDFGSPCAEISAAAQRVLELRYLLRDENGKIIETPTEMFARVARAVARAESQWAPEGEKAAYVEATAREFFRLMSSLKFVPNSPALMNAGKKKGQLSACFVLPIADDLGEVFETLREAMVIHKTGGGTGFNFGALRPAGDSITGSGGKASGPVSFLKIYDVATQTVKQGGVRRGANMAILPASHPDIEAFIRSKLEGGIENFNLSVGVSDAFMQAVAQGKSWELVNPRNGLVSKSVSARKLWSEIVSSAWACGDPGVVFLDEINRHNPTPELGKIESTNPCGEQPLLAYESCILGSLNLVAYRDGDGLDWKELERDIAVAVRFLDNVIEENYYPVHAIEETTRATRKLGLGVMGWADLLMEWEIPYDGEEAVQRADEMMKRLNAVAVKASEELALERGAFPAFAESIWAARGEKPRRNATVTTIAPTGTISIIAGVSSGIEPVFSLAHERATAEGKRMLFVHPALKRGLQKANVRSRKVLERILERGAVEGVGEIPARARRFLRTAHEIAPVWHVRMQAAFQKHTENGVSKTINLPATAKTADVRKLYELAYKSGCKGITVFRDASKRSQVLRRGLSGNVGTSRRDLVEAVDWLLDDRPDEKNTRKRVSVGLASLSRSEIKKGREDGPT